MRPLLKLCGGTGVRVERRTSADSDDWEEFLSRYLFAGVDALRLAMAQSHNLELITADPAVLKATLDDSARALRELLSRLIYYRAS